MTVPMPRIVIHESDHSPSEHRFLGGYYLSNKRLPMIFLGGDRDALIEKMRVFWEEEQTKATKLAAYRAARAARMRKGAAVQ